jgi:hypothetical protein
MGSLCRTVRVRRIAFGLAALAASLLGASSAQAALGTSPQFAPQNRPYLTSITDQGGTGLVNFCFGTSGGQAITAPGGGYDPNDFLLNGYDNAVSQSAATVSQLNNNCVQVTFALGEIGEYSVGNVFPNAVVAIISGNPVGNLTDSAPLIGSSSNNGTRGFTSGLDLVNVLSPGSNRLAFVFDQDVSTDNLPGNCPGATCPTQDLLFYDGGGTLHGNTAANQAIISISDNVVVVQYSNPPDPVADARIGLVRHAAQANDPGGPVFLLADTPFTAMGAKLRFVTLGTAAVAGVAGSGNTALIEPTGAALVNGGNSNQIDFTFETNVAAGAASAGCFTATASDTARLFGDAVSVNNNVVTVTFAGMQDFTERITRAGVQAPDPGPTPIPPAADPANCVQSATGAVVNTMAGLPVGGNVGAVATGYTDGPEALAGITVSGGNVTVPIDQRLAQNGVTLGRIHLLDDQGNAIGGPPSNAAVTGNGSATDPHAVTFTFDPVAVAAAAGMQWLGYPTGPAALATPPNAPNDEMIQKLNSPQTFALP